MTLRKRRDKTGLTQRAIAEKIGVTSQMIYLYESGKIKPSVGTARKLCEVYCCTLDEIYGKEEA